MIAVLPPLTRATYVARAAACLLLTFGAGLGSLSLAQQNVPSQAPPQNSTEQQLREAGPPRRIPRQQALTTAALDGTVREQAADSAARPVAGARIMLRNLQTGQVSAATASGDGVFRMLLLIPGNYEFRVEADGYAPLSIASLSLNANEVVTLEVHLAVTGTAEMKSHLPRQPALGPPLPAEAAATMGTYHEFRHRLDSDPNYILELCARRPAAGCRCLQRGAEPLGVGAAGLSALWSDGRIHLRQSPTGTTRSIAIVSRATSPSGRNSSGNKCF